MTRTARTSLVLLLVMVFTAGTTVAAAHPSRGSESQPYRATIRWTSHGIPHVLADDLGSAGFGHGWAYAHDRGCDLADQIVKVRSERARWFGRGQGDEHVASDIAYQALGVRDQARRSLRTMPTDPKSLIAGYAAGYNAYLERVGAAGFPGWCRGKPWVRPISALDLVSYQLDVAMLQSGRQLLAPIALAQPPGSRQNRLSTNPTSVKQGVSRLVSGSHAGSNAWAIGRERTAGASSRLVGNPHFPWQGEFAFWESHVTVPGVLDAYGAGLGGVPGVQIGFNRHVAWTATVAPGTRHTFYSLQLADGDPTAYVVDGKTERMRQGLLMITAAVAVTVGCGHLLAALAPRLLGPTPEERLAALDSRTTRLLERTRLARELHDSVGHALSLIVLHTAVARRRFGEGARGKDAAHASLTACEDAAQVALADLDGVLGLLRDEDDASPRQPSHDLTALPELARAACATGQRIDLETNVDTGDPSPGHRRAVDASTAALPPLISREAYRIVQEGVTNALRHAPDQPVSLRVHREPGSLTIEISNPVSVALVRRRTAERRGRGLIGLSERVDVLGGELSAGVDRTGAGDEPQWQIRVTLPVLGDRS